MLTELNSGDKALLKVTVLSSDSNHITISVKGCGNFVIPEKYRSQLFVLLKQDKKSKT